MIRFRKVKGIFIISLFLLFLLIIYCVSDSEVFDGDDDDFDELHNKMNLSDINGCIEKIHGRFQLQNCLKPPYPRREYKRKSRTYSQAKQDLAAYRIFPRERGFFLEMGAFDGQKWSNTLWLEAMHGWTGLLIEANPYLCSEIDKKRRHAWRLCGCISDQHNATFLRGSALGGVEAHIDKHHIKLLSKNETFKVTVPCFRLLTVLDAINLHHINYFSLDVEGAELFILNTIKDDLRSNNIIVDVWTVEYRVWDGEKIVFEASLDKLTKLRTFFNDIGGYAEHSQLSNDKNKKDGLALDVLFVNTKTWCQTHKTLPNGARCKQ